MSTSPLNLVLIYVLLAEVVVDVMKSRVPARVAPLTLLAVCAPPVRSVTPVLAVLNATIQTITCVPQ